MAFKYGCFTFLVMVLPPALCYFGNFENSRATYYGSPDCKGTPTGACGYGEYGRTVNDANVAGVSRLWKNGIGCGACYQVRCKAQQCTGEGITVVVTDYGDGDRTDFILSAQAYARMARQEAVAELFAYGVVDVDYRRVPCLYNGYNILFKVHEHSKFPDYLAIVILYQAGVYDVLAVEIWQEDSKQWRGMRRAYGAVFDIASPPIGALRLRFQVSGYGQTYWVQADNAIPGDWKPGVAYDSQIQLD